MFCPLNRYKSMVQYQFSSGFGFHYIVMETYGSLAPKKKVCYIHKLSANFASWLLGGGQVVYRAFIRGFPLKKR